MWGSIETMDLQLAAAKRWAREWTRTARRVPPSNRRLKAMALRMAGDYRREAITLHSRIKWVLTSRSV